jgi:glycosyltransferase involved in cell wall biosynthesis
MKRFSVVIPVFNRPNEVLELMESLQAQSNKNFELIVVEDGSTEKSDKIIAQFPEIASSYFFKENSGPGDSRNFGMAKAKGEYILFFDSDCVIPPQYFEVLEASLNKHPLDAFGGPDNADVSFTDVQKAINYAMTSIFTTGGVRGKKNKLDNFQPRSFNMGIKKEVYAKVGGFSDIHPGEDPDLSYRIMDAGFSTGLIEEAFVYHKRRIDFSKFIKQVYKFGTVRRILMKWYPSRTKLVYFFPAIFLLGSLMLLILGLLTNSVFIGPLLAFALLLFIDATRKTKNLKIGAMAVLASFIQLYSYAYGFIKSYLKIHLLKQEERKAYPDFFFFK